MTWTKLGEEFPDEAADLSDAAFRLHVEALAWSNRRLLDQMVPKRDVRRFTFVQQADEAAAELVAAGWWQDCGKDWFIGVRFPEWQQDRDYIEHRRAANRATQRRKRKHDIGNHSLCVPGRCKGLSSGDACDDTSDSSGSDPDRIGSDRFGETQRPNPLRTGRVRDGRSDASPVNEQPTAGRDGPSAHVVAATDHRTPEQREADRRRDLVFGKRRQTPTTGQPGKDALENSWTA